MERALDDARTLLELAAEAGDDAARAEAEGSLDGIEHEVEKLELERMLSGENDHANAYMEINAGAGGTESMDWAAMLLRMYSDIAESKGWTVEINDFVAGEEAGLKNVSIKVTGENAYGYLKAENGVHRLVRISPFDANARRQTSFASVTVYPELDDDIVIDIPEKDVRDRRLPRERRRRPEGEQDLLGRAPDPHPHRHHRGDAERAQPARQPRHGLEDPPVAPLRPRDAEAKPGRADEAESQKKDIAFGSQIRSYVLAPYRMVKDLRTGVETGNVDAVLDGELDDFVTAQLLGVKNPNRAVPE